MENQKENSTRENDTFRIDTIESLKNSTPSEDLRVSRWVNNLSLEQLEKLFNQILTYRDWSPETDLFGNHTAGVIKFEGHTILWVIKKYDPAAGMVLTIEPNFRRGLFVKHSAEI